MNMSGKSSIPEKACARRHQQNISRWFHWERLISVPRVLSCRVRREPGSSERGCRRNFIVFILQARFSDTARIWVGTRLFFFHSMWKWGQRIFIILRTPDKRMWSFNKERKNRMVWLRHSIYELSKFIDFLLLTDRLFLYVMFESII